MAVIDKSFGELVVSSSVSISDALGRICENKSRMVLVVDEQMVLVGLATDGDFRRWVVEQDEIDLALPVQQIMRSSFISVSEEQLGGNLDELFQLREGTEIIPALDNRGRLISVVRRQQDALSINGREIGVGLPTYFIAEIGNNHNGCIDRAKSLIDAVAKSGAECAKFQLRDMDTLYSNATSGNKAASEDLGTEYTLDLLHRFQLPVDHLYQAFDYCKSKGVEPLCTPWDINSLQRLEAYGISAYKIASADFTNHQLIEAVAQTGKPLIVSTGMASEREIRDGIQFLKRIGCRFVLMHCNATYPTPFKDVNLRYLHHLKELGASNVGYSGHERGMEVPIAAVALGASVIEKHITLDKNLEGNDHKVSLLPAEFTAMVEQVRNVESALGFSAERSLSQGEMMNREVLGKSVIAGRDIKLGEVVSAEMLEVRSPGQGLPPYRMGELVGRVSKRALAKGDCFFAADLDDIAVTPREYNFARNFGIPVRYHDASTLLNKSNFSLVEFHLSYRDLELKADEFFSDQSKLNLVVHSPELFEHDHLFDLCNPDKDYRQKSIEHLKRVVNATVELRRFFPEPDKALVVVNVGGHTHNKPIASSEKVALYRMVAEGLREAENEQVEFIPQSMPPYPWHFGGQRLHNLFVSADDIVEFCVKNNFRICLDVSHSKLACVDKGWHFDEFLRAVLPHTAHLHIADSVGVDGEGLQIGAGEIDFVGLGRALSEVPNSVGFIPEIWQGHKNDGEGFWAALERLETALN